LAIQVRPGQERVEALVQLLLKTRLIQTLRHHLKPFFLGGLHGIPLVKGHLFRLRVPPGLHPAQPVAAAPKRLPHGSARFFQAGFSAAQADRAADIPEQVPLLLNLLADLREALLHLHRLVLPHVQQHRDALFLRGNGIDVCQRPQLPPDDLQGVPEHDLIAVLILRGVGHIHLYQRGKADALCKMKAVARVRLRRVQEGLLALGGVPQHLHQQLLLPLAAFFQLEFQRGLFSQLVAQPQQNAGELLLLEGLEQVILHTVFQRVLRVFKFPVPADDDKMQVRLQVLGPLDQLDSAAPGHPDVRDQQVGPFFPHQLQCPQAVVGGTDDLIAQLFPVDELLQQQEHFIFIICQNNPQHGAFLRFLYKERENETVFPFFAL